MRLFVSFLSVFSVGMAYELGGLLSGNQMAGVPLGVSLGDGELDVEGICTRPGVACQNCTHAVTCIALPIGWLMVPLHACSEDQTCNARQGGCSDEAAPECDITTKSFEHKCEQVGIFPDAYDCRKFHLCSPPADVPSGRPADHRAAVCPRHYAYNPYTAQCSIKLPYGQCESRPVPECSMVGQTEVLPTSPNHYYVCLSKQGKVYPQIFICPHGLNFWGGFCRSETETKNTTDKALEPKIEGSESKTQLGVVTVRINEYPPDTFLADKFDLSNYETIDDIPYIPQQSSYEFSSSSVESF